MTIRKIKSGIIMVSVLVIISSATLLMQLQQQQAEAGLFDFGHLRKAPVAISGENVYVAWQSNNTANGNEEIMFRGSINGEQIFGDKINLSNTTYADSSRVEIDSDVNSVVVTWWETNQTSDTPVMRISNDNGVTFGPIMNISSNGTIGEN
jgi:hypothetical protein